MIIQRPTKDEYYLNIAKVVTERSTCLRRHYGCVIVKDDVIVATGYNGSPRGEENCCERHECKRVTAERYQNYEECDSVHAEQNALMSASREELKGATLYLSCMNDDNMWEGQDNEWIEDNNPVPCSLCMRMIRNSGITKVMNRKGIIWQC